MNVPAKATHPQTRQYIRRLAREVARRTLTLVRDEARNVPFRLAPDERILLVMPRPVDLTPADTSSTAPPGQAAALRTVHHVVDALFSTGRPVVTHLCTYPVGHGL